MHSFRQRVAARAGRRGTTPEAKRRPRPCGRPPPGSLWAEDDPAAATSIPWTVS